MSNDIHLAAAREVLAAEAQGLVAASKALGESFGECVKILLATEGKAVLTGIGKSGHVAGKIAATLASTGTPAFYVHPADAGHGDLGMITANDTVIALSHSGTASELTPVLDHGKRLGNKLIALTGNADSPLARASDAFIEIAVSDAAGPLGLAPTISTTAAMAIGDALAMALVKARGFRPEDFARTHPDGELGRKLLIRVEDLMLSGDELPQVTLDATLAEAIVEMSAKRLGMTLIEDGDGGLAGILTDGDLRRCLEANSDIHSQRVSERMSPSPKTISRNRLASEALAVMEEHRITHLPVIEEKKIAGVIDIHLLMRNRIA